MEKFSASDGGIYLRSLAQRCHEVCCTPTKTMTIRAESTESDVNKSLEKVWGFYRGSDKGWKFCDVLLCLWVNIPDRFKRHDVCPTPGELFIQRHSTTSKTSKSSIVQNYFCLGNIFTKFFIYVPTYWRCKGEIFPRGIKTTEEQTRKSISIYNRV